MSYLLGLHSGSLWAKGVGRCKTTRRRFPLAFPKAPSSVGVHPGSPEAEPPGVLGASRAGARRPGCQGPALRSRAGPVTWAVQPAPRFPYKDLGLTSPAPGLALECAERKSAGQTHPFANRKGGRETYTAREDIEKMET